MSYQRRASCKRIVRNCEQVAVASVMEGYAYEENFEKASLVVENKRNKKLLHKERKTKTYSTSSSNNGSQIEKLYCICKSPYDGTRPMIECDSCKDWFHFDCVSLKLVNKLLNRE